MPEAPPTASKSFSAPAISSKQNKSTPNPGTAPASTTMPTTGLAASTNATSTEKPWSVQSVVSALPSHSKPTLSPPPQTPIPFLHLLERLKTSPRAGWTRFSVPHPESIADHMYRMSILCLVMPRSLARRIDRAKCVNLALVHDMAEALVGDITPVDGVAKGEKRRREAETMAFLGWEVLGGYDCDDDDDEGAGAQGRELKSLWEEYEAGETEEAKFVKDVDKLELLLQMVEYERRGQGELDLGEFVWVAGHVKGDVCKGWTEVVMEERKAFWADVGKRPKASGTVVGGECMTENEGWDAQGGRKKGDDGA